MELASEIEQFRSSQSYVCLLLNGTSILFRLLLPRIVEIKQTTGIKHDLKHRRRVYHWSRGKQGLRKSLFSN